MIRINLLATGKPKKGRARRKLFTMPQVTTAGPSPVFAGLGLLVLAGAGFHWYYGRLEATHEQLQVSIQEANRSIASMTKVKQAYIERQREYDAFKRRFDIIDQLRASQTGPVPLLSNVSDTVNHTDGVWLQNLRDEDATVTIDGISLGPNAVANLMTNLKRSGYFKNVELKETVQEEGQKVPTFTFTLICEKAKA